MIRLNETIKITNVGHYQHVHPETTVRKLKLVSYPDTKKSQWVLEA